MPPGDVGGAATSRRRARRRTAPGPVATAARSSSRRATPRAFGAPRSSRARARRRAGRRSRGGDRRRPPRPSCPPWPAPRGDEFVARRRAGGRVSRWGECRQIAIRRRQQRERGEARRERVRGGGVAVVGSSGRTWEGFGIAPRAGVAQRAGERGRPRRHGFRFRRAGARAPKITKLASLDHRAVITRPWRPPRLQAPRRHGGTRRHPQRGAPRRPRRRRPPRDRAVRRLAHCGRGSRDRGGAVVLHPLPRSGGRRVGARRTVLSIHRPAVRHHGHGGAHGRERFDPGQSWWSAPIVNSRARTHGRRVQPVVGRLLPPPDVHPDARARGRSSRGAPAPTGRRSTPPACRAASTTSCSG